jgi:hypothetical protein
MAFSFEFDQICPAELPEEKFERVRHLVGAGWKIRNAAEIIIGWQFLKAL